MSEEQFDLVVIGAGPGGEVGAIRAAQLGMKVAIVDKREHLGGTCLNVGCIPTKALIESAKMLKKMKSMDQFGIEISDYTVNWDKVLGRKEDIVNTQRKGLQFLMKKNKIKVFQGTASFTNAQTISVKGKDTTETLKTKYTLIATGSKVRELPFAQSNGKNILTSDTIMDIKSVPKSLAVVGGGVVGMEFACLFSFFGSEVTVIELADQVLPFEDPETAKEVVRCFKKYKIKIENNAQLKKVEDLGKKCKVTVELTKKGSKSTEELEFEKVLMSVGRQAVTEGLGLDLVQLKTDQRGFIPVDSHYKTEHDHIFAIGDVINTPALAHTASAEAKHAVEIIAGERPPIIDYNLNPSAIYTYPEVASIGKTEPYLKDQNISYKVAKFPFAPLAKAKIEEATDGFIKILYGPEFHEILGVHIVGAKATELISEFVLGAMLETTVDEIGRAIHPHPTISETIIEAAHVAESGAIHM